VILPRRQYFQIEPMKVARTTVAATLPLVCGLMLIAAPAPACAQRGYPSKPMRLIVASTTGASSDLSGRLIAQKLSESWGQQVIVDNRPGANGVIAGEALVKAAPDGHTLLQVTVTHLINGLVVPKLPYDTVKDFAPVATFTNSPYVLTVNAALPVQNLADFITHAKAKPGQLNYGTAGNASAAHLTAEILSSLVGIKMQHIPYKGGGLVLTDLVGGQLQVYLATALTTAPYINSGRIKALAIAAQARVAALPQVLTFREAGTPGFDVKNWFGIAVPAATPRPLIDKLSAEIARIVAMPDTVARLASQGGEPLLSTPGEFAALISADMARLAGIIKSAKISLVN
jgi:tripartite-type tricarboxylate transporter receptor subunit TctC